MNIRDIVIEIVATELDTDTSTVASATSLDALGVDSPHLVELALAIEDRFGFPVPDAALARFRTVDDVIAYVQRHIRS